MRERIRSALARTFEIPVEEVGENVTSEDLDDWDSLRHLELMLEIELAFGVTISSEAMPELLSVEAIEDYLVEQGVAGER